MADIDSESVKSVKTRIRKGDVVSTQGSIVQILKFEGGKIVARHLGSADVCFVNPSHVQVNLSVVGELEEVHRSRQRTQFSWNEGQMLEVRSQTIGEWCAGKIIRRFLLTEHPDVCYDLWFEIVFWDHIQRRPRYKQLRYDDHFLRQAQDNHHPDVWKLLEELELPSHVVAEQEFEESTILQVSEAKA